MKNLIIILVILFATQAHAFNAVKALPQDKAFHVIAGTLVYAGCHIAGFSNKVCLATVVAVGIGKELLWDSALRKTVPDKWDAAATIGGGLLGYTITW